MERKRTIAAAPMRTAHDAWHVIVKLIADTIERSPAVEAGSVSKEMKPLAGLGPALIAAGHFEASPLVLKDEALELSINVVTGQAAFDVDENLNPVPGGAQVSDQWKLHVPCPKPLAHVVVDAVSKSDHLSTDGATEKATSGARRSSRSSEELVDADALRRSGESS